VSRIFFGSFPVSERVLVERVLQRARVPSSEVKFSKAVFSGTHMPESLQEMVTFVHGRLSRTYAASRHGAWIEQFATDLAAGRLRADPDLSVGHTVSAGVPLERVRDV
jgi:hypothetical protein